MVAIAAGASRARGQETIPTWEDAVSWGVGPYPWGLDAADAMGPTGPNEDDLDGYPDIAIAIGQIDLISGGWTGLTGEVRVYSNEQDWTPPGGGLTLRQVIPLDHEHLNTLAADVVWADMTGDERPDLVISATTHFYGTQEPGAFGFYVYEWVGGAEPFQFKSYQHTSILVGSASIPVAIRGLVVADFDNDGDKDAAAALDFLESGSGRDYLVVSMNDGTGGLLPETSHELGVEPASQLSTIELATGRFDGTPGGNTLPDLFTTRHDSELADGVSLTNMGSGAFTATSIVPPCAEFAFADIAVGRFTTGKLCDDVAGIGIGNGALYVLHCGGNANFTHDCDGTDDDIYLESGGPQSLVLSGLTVGHINGGTRPDIVVAPFDDGVGDAYVTFLLGKGNGKFQHDPGDSAYDVPLGSFAERPMRVIVADLDQDGFGDIATSNHGTTATTGSLTVLLNALEVGP